MSHNWFLSFRLLCLVSLKNVVVQCDIKDLYTYYTNAFILKDLQFKKKYFLLECDSSRFLREGGP